MMEWKGLNKNPETGSKADGPRQRAITPIPTHPDDNTLLSFFATDQGTKTSPSSRYEERGS